MTRDDEHSMGSKVHSHPSVKRALKEIEKRELHGSTLISRIALDALGEVAAVSKAKKPQDLFDEVNTCGMLLLSARPTSVLLANGIRFATHRLKDKINEGLSVRELREFSKSQTVEFFKTIEESVKKIGEIGARRLSSGDVVLTHGYSSSVLSIVRKGRKDGKKIKAIVTESRPEFEGRLVARQLIRMGVPTTLIIDSAVSHFIREVDKVLVGAEAVAANGAIVNKVGTSTIASVAHESRVRVFAAASIYKFNPETMFGELIEIEERDPHLVVPRSEVRGLRELKVRNIAFDVTPPEHIDLIITEIGVVPPQGVIMILKERRELPIVAMEPTLRFEQR